MTFQSPLVTRVGSAAVRLSLSVALASALTSPLAHGFTEFGGGTLNFNALAQLMSDSNVFGNTTDENDIVYIARPELSFRREGARGTTNLSTGVWFNRYSDFSVLNSEDFYAKADVQVPTGGGRLSGGLNLDYFDGAEADEFIGQRVDIKRLSFTLNSSYELSARSAFRLGATLSNYDATTRPSADSYSLRLGLASRIRQRVSAFLDVSHGSTKSTNLSPGFNPLDYDTNSANLGLDGQFSPKVHGSISVGYQDIDASGADTTSAGSNVISNVSLQWQARQNTSISLSGGRNTRVTSSAQSIDATNASIGIDHQFNAALKATVTLLWETFKTSGLSNQSDDRVVAKLDLTYSVHDRLGFGGGIHHNVRYAYNPLFDISRTTLQVYARVTF